MVNTVTKATERRDPTVFEGLQVERTTAPTTERRAVAVFEGLQVEGTTAPTSEVLQYLHREHPTVNHLHLKFLRPLTLFERLQISTKKTINICAQKLGLNPTFSFPILTNVTNLLITDSPGLTNVDERYLLELCPNFVSFKRTRK